MKSDLIDGAERGTERPVVQLWLASIEHAVRQLLLLEALLSADERSRAERFRVTDRRARFVAGRGVLRSILAQATGRLPESLVFHYGPHGKPSLVSAPDGPELRFNASHSDDLLVVATTIDRDVGVDVEHVRPEAASEELARRVLAPEDADALVSLPPAERPETFFRHWTRIEARLKARGLPLASALSADRRAVSGWSCRSLCPRPGFVASVALAGEDDWELRVRDWPG